MPSNFEETSVSRNAKRPYSPIFDLETFEAAVQKFIDDTTMGFTKKEPASETYKAKIEYSAADGTDKGYLTYYAPDTETFATFTALLENKTTAETAGGTDAYTIRDEVDDAWSVKYSCAIGDDTFNITITRDYMLINGFAKDTTLEAIETWADTVEEFGGEAL